MKAAWCRQQGPSQKVIEVGEMPTHAFPLIIPNSDSAGVGSRRDIN